MSIQQGYGKIVTNGIVFQYDLGDKINCYKGEPTTNKIPNASNNGRFTTSNTWGTYNTNQYNGGSYFSIGTINNVTNNIVTTNSAHPFRTYDAVMPQTTGGGLVGGTTYFINVINDTQFSLHTYNGSENGSQGYINPLTGMYKVHDSIGNDIRISINSSGFPTMWWGPPHYPNTCHVKEIVTNGGYVRGTNCMRIHVTRTIGVDGGMAYGVYTPVNINDLITVSFYAKAGNLNGIGATVQYETYFGGASSFSSTFILTEDWVRVVFQWTSSATYSFIQYFSPIAYTNPYDFDMADLQVEVNKGHATAFTTGTRTSTDSLYDLSSNSNLSVSNVSFNSNSNITFDGINDSIVIPSNLPIFNFQFYQTIEIILQPLESDGNRRNPYSQSFGGFGTITHEAYNSFQYYYGTSGGDGTPYDHVHSVFTVNQNEVAHICLVRTPSQIKWYKNGKIYNTKSNIYGILPDDSNDILIGNGYTNSYYGNIFVVKLYNIGLSDIEVLKNYNHYKKRFNLP